MNKRISELFFVFKIHVSSALLLFFVLFYSFYAVLLRHIYAYLILKFNIYQLT